ncbi:MAG TPA: D-alanyl-D-alanine carboxypeptidase family protein [Rhizomicrobium sp.]|jgi:D-alanyl-D-alanine carboxypeptidase (penicillin-binding protein 5/6)|nr:D-alanyl-D-alanine carboxypeptidase family protein [Rhizomicrobium sp.]
MFHRLIGVASVVICLGLTLSSADADITTTANHALLMDAQSGDVLWQKDAETPMPPASMSKLMTLELLFQRIKDGRVKLKDTFPVSERAWRERAGSECFVNIGDRMTVESLIQCIIIVSGNDSTIVVAEALGGTVEGFVTMMNARARELGLKQSHFVNPDGLDVPPGQMMSALDLAKLARHIIYAYPNLYHYFGEKDFVWSNIHQPNRNPLLFNTPGADGLKTGHIEASGYGLVGSAARDGRRIIVVLNGLASEKDRADEGARMIEAGFREFRRYQLFKPGDSIAEADVYGGSDKTVPLTVKTPVVVTLQVDSRPGMKVAVHYNSPLAAPIAQGQQVGTLSVTAPDFPGVTTPLYAAHDVAKVGIFGRMMLGIRALFGGNK